MKRISPGQLLAQSYLAWRQTPPRLGALLQKYVVPWVVLAILALMIVGIAYALVEQLDIRWLAVFALGLVVGAIARDIGWARRFVAAWPFMQRLLDWQAVERQAAAPDTPANDAPVSPPRSRPGRAVAIGLAGGLVLLLIVLGTDRVLLRVYDPRPSNAPGNVIIYTTAWCPYCEALRVQLRKSGIPYTELDVEKSLAASYGHRSVGGRGIPVTVIGQEVVHGLQREKLDGVLRAAGHVPAAWTESTGNPAGPVTPAQ